MTYIKEISVGRAHKVVLVAGSMFFHITLTKNRRNYNNDNDDTDDKDGYNVIQLVG